MTLHVEAAGITHRGTVRERNEDCIAIGFWVNQETMEAARTFDQALEEPFACIVADGMGGHNDGDQASQLVAKNLSRRLSVMGPEKAGTAARAVNAEFYKHVGEHPELAGMGSTVVGLSAQGGNLAIFNVGDSRAYRLEGGKLVQLSTDDSLVPDWKPGSGKPRSTMLTQCFGGRDVFTDIEPNVRTEAAKAGALYLLCCDGLYETLPEEQMAALIGPDLKASCEALLKAALAAKARDNVTIALVRVVDKAPA
ncbi:MAG TPA: PP2C family serine/threonine-protein phosphatase [Burkholderiales bacterium]|nr:PP2C family serine/threonine-protein phosphatase [Burkholderiales bacterium]